MEQIYHNLGVNCADWDHIFFPSFVLLRFTPTVAVHSTKCNLVVISFPGPLIPSMHEQDIGVPRPIWHSFCFFGHG